MGEGSQRKRGWEEMMGREMMEEEGDGKGRGSKQGSRSGAGG